MKRLLFLSGILASFSLVAMEEKPKLAVTLIAGVYKYEMMIIESTTEKMWGISAADNNKLWHQIPVLQEYRREFKNPQETIYYGHVLYGQSKIPYCAPKSAFSEKDQALLQ